jgi:hypothetical protein
MKFFNLLTIFVSLVITVLAADDYQITHYGCPRKCSSQEHSSCGIDTYPLKSGATKYFCALSTHFTNYDKFCGQRVVIMLTDGSENMINVQVVDSCSSCPKYHVDLSSYSFEELLPLKKGEADCIWAVFDTSGKKLSGPIYKSVDKAASAFGLSKDGFINAFLSNASKMAKSGRNVASFGKSSGGYDEEVTSKKTTTTKKSTSIVVITKIVSKQTTSTPVAAGTTTLPAKQTVTNLGVKTIVANSTTTGIASPKTINPVTTNIPSTSPETIVKGVPGGEEKENIGETGGVDSTIGILGIGAGICTAAGLGLLLMKKKSPGTYDSMKQKFPEAFSQIKRGVSRRATSLKRKVTTRRTPLEN